MPREALLYGIWYTVYLWQQALLSDGYDQDPMEWLNE